MNDERIIFDGIYFIGGPNISRSEDATSFIVDCGDELVMIDSGAGRSIEILEKNFVTGFDLKNFRPDLTHCQSTISRART